MIILLPEVVFNANFKKNCYILFFDFVELRIEACYHILLFRSLKLSSVLEHCSTGFFQ